jgi:hypothetical protein
MRTPTIAAVVAAALLAGCGGGGSSGPSVPPGGSPSGSQLSTQDVVQSATDAAFGPIADAEADSAVINGSLGNSSAARSAQSLGHGCKSRTTRTVSVSGGSVTVTTNHYFDAACTELESDTVAIYTASGNTATVNRTVTTYNMAELQLGVRKQTYTLTGSTSSGTWTVMSAFYVGTSATPMTQYGHNATLNASAYAATTAGFTNDAKPSINAAYGRQSSVNATVSTDSSGDVTFTGTRNGTEFKGALNGLTISSAPPFTISGGSQLGTSQLNGAVTFDSDGNLEAVALTGTLPGGNTINVTSSVNTSGVVTVSGTITSPTNAPVATFTTDADGNGILTLANGTQLPIVDWHVVWS